MALAIDIRYIQERIIKELEDKQIEVKNIHSYKLGNKMYLFNIICTDRRLGELKLHKSIIKQIANSIKVSMLIQYHINEIHWSA